MTNFIRRNLRRLAAETHGAEIAEAAAVLPIMFMVILGIFWFGQAFSIYGTVTRAAQDGARAASAPSCTTCASGSTRGAIAYSAIQSDLIAANLDPTKLQPPTTTPNLLSCVNGTTVNCDSSPGNVCVQESVQLTTPGSGGTGECGIAVSLQYPYQFWLPFTSLNRQLIKLNAAARVRLETL
jgi:Flp pilus assembly protein TadG